MTRSAKDYHAQLRSLLPPGPAWDIEFNPEVDQLLQLGAELLAVEDKRALDLLGESDPDRVRELVPDWERVMQLPDPCLGDSPLFEDRRLAVRRRLIEVCRAGYRPRLPERQGDRAPRAAFRAGALRLGPFRHLGSAVHVDAGHRAAPASRPPLRGRLLRRNLRRQPERSAGMSVKA